MEAATDLRSLGEGLAWLTTQLLDDRCGGALRSWLGLKAVKCRAGRGRKRPSLPIPAGHFAGLMTRLKHHSLATLAPGQSLHDLRRVAFRPVAPSGLEDEEKGVDAWLLCSTVGCNLLAGYRELLPAGETSALQRSAIDQLRPTLKRSLEPGGGPWKLQKES